MEFPLNGECFKRNMVFKAKVDVEGQGRFFYVGQTSSTFKSRLGNHKSDFNLRHRNGTTLSRFIWKLKDEGKAWTIQWEKVCEATLYCRETRHCNLCSEEKLEISKMMTEHPDNTINKRNELLNYCHHIRKEMLDHPDEEIIQLEPG